MTLPENMIDDVLTHRGEALRLEAEMAVREGWSAHRISELAADRVVVLDELHGRAAEENEVRDVTAVLETWEVQALLLAASREKQPLLIDELTRRGVSYHTS